MEPEHPEPIERRVKPMGTGAGIHLPKTWIGKLVKVIPEEKD